MEKISLHDLMFLTPYQEEGLLEIDLAYTRNDNLLFGEPIYKPNAKLTIHKILGEITIAAAKTVRIESNLKLVVYDALRTIEAQARMLNTQRVKDNPHWLEEPRLLSPPGSGGHPRGMAVDVALKDSNGTLLDMGTPFDFLAEDSSAEKNPAHRHHPHLSDKARTNRDILDKAMCEAAQALGTPLFPLTEEWWDFRLPAEIYEKYAPLSDQELPEDMQCL